MGPCNKTPCMYACAGVASFIGLNSALCVIEQTVFAQLCTAVRWEYGQRKSQKAPGVKLSCWCTPHALRRHVVLYHVVDVFIRWGKGRIAWCQGQGVWALQGLLAVAGRLPAPPH